MIMLGERQWIIFLLITWVVVVGLVICAQWNKRLPSVGLPLSYLLNLSVIHWFGAMIYAFPWYTPQSAYIISQGVSLANTTAGFNQSVCGVLGFGFGTIILAPWLLKMFKPSWFWSVPNQPNLKLPKFYILLGLLFYFFLTPILNRIPSISALASSGFALLSVGLCLACWKALCLHNNKDLIRWLALSCCIPLMTILNAGFISFGTTAAVPILIFVFHFYRPRWQVIIIALLALVLGLTVFVNYLRDREELRARIWGSTLR